LDSRHVCKACALHDALQAGKQKEVHHTPLIWRLWVPALFHTHRRSLMFCRLQPTRTQSCDCLNITASMAGAINTRCDHATSTYFAMYKHTLSYRKRITNLQFIRQSGIKERIEKTASTNHTAMISINYTTM
jgi:hypothetical protein